MQKLFEKLVAWKKRPNYVPYNVASHLRKLQMRNEYLEDILKHVIKNTPDEKIKNYIQNAL